MKKTKKYFIIDFDSTFIKGEGLDQFAEIVLKGNPKMGEIVQSIKRLTTMGMEGKISFEESLKRRLTLIKGTRKDIEKNVRLLKKNISASIRRNKDFFKTYKDQIYIISGGFKEFIMPVTKSFGIPESHVLANSFIFSKRGEIVGCEQKNPLAHSNGKVKMIKSLKLKGEIYVIGDGHTDYLIKKAGLATKFIAFTENISREAVIQKADYIAPNFDEFLYIKKLPRSFSYPKNRIKVLLLDKVDKMAISFFEKEGFSVDYVDQPLTDNELKLKIHEVSVVAVRSRTKLTPEIITSTQRLMCIGRFGIGVDNIDLRSASEKGVVVFNAPYSNTRSVVEFVLGEIIMLMRGIGDKTMKMHQGVWDKKTANAHEIRGKTLGIIGYGNIGSQLSILAEAIGMRIVYFDILDKLPLGNAKRCFSLAELLKQSDIISIHMSGNPKSYLIGKKELQMMKRGAYLINTSRGKAVDTEVLAEFIKQGRLGGAAFDVFQNEPKSKDQKFISALQNIPNVILTPHIAGSTEESQKNIAEFVCGKMLEFINLGNTYLSINLPNIQLPKLKDAHRLLHLHKNVPGILAKINSVLAQNRINILGQYLKTNEYLGYVITDVNRKYDKKVLEELRTIPNTIRFRVLY